MSRIRSIKPEFWTAEQIVECSTNARLLFIGLWTFSDDYGVHPASPRRLKMEVFPADNFSAEDIAEWMHELIAAGLVIEYAAGDRQFWQVTGWRRHQRIESPTGRYPQPDGTVGATVRPKHSTNHSTNAPRTIADRSALEKEKEKEKEKPPKAPRSAKASAAGVGFEQFWQAYPKKVSKGQAEKAFERLNPDATLLATILAAVEHAKSRPDWTKEAGRFIPHPATWLNAKGWADEYGPAEDPYSRDIFAGVL